MSIEKNLNNLVINKVESQDVYNYMKANSLINADELYFVSGNEEEVNIPAAGDTLGTVKSGGDVTISDGIITVNDDSHDHVISNVDGLQGALDSKVDKIDGKGLSTNDLTSTLKSNYDAAYTHSQQPHASADAEKNVIVGVQKNGTDLAVNSSTRKVNITVPTKTSELTNDSDFATTSDLDAKVDKVTGKGLSTNDYTTEEKTKLANIEDGANKTIVDTVLSSTSTNPVQNKAINTKLDSMQSDIDSKVPSSRTVNGKALTANITLSASDVGALPDTTVIPSIDGLATETYVNNKVAGLVGSAPETLDTLNELAAALGGDANFATTVANQIGTKVDKVDGKGLSANDYTDAEKAKLEGIATGAQVNQNAFSNVIVGSITIAADDVTDSLTLAAGDNVTINADAANDKITISAIDTTYNEAGTELGLVKSGGDVTISNGVITVNDDSHNHIISNVDGLQAELDSKVNVETGKGLSTNDLTDVLKENYDTAYIHSQQPHNYAGSSTSGGAATSANKLNTDAGSETQPVYFKNGVPIVTNTLDSVAFDGYVTKGAESGSTIGVSATVEGGNNMASSKQSHAEGGYTRAGDLTLYSESTGMFDSYGYEHAEGYSTLAKKCAAHAEGAHTQAIALMAHAEGLSTIASGGKSHAEGHSTTASGANAHAEGHSTTASGENTHAEGDSTTASSQAAHAEGHSTEASGYASHSEGASTIASGSYSHAEGFYTKAASQYQHAQGKYNIEDTANTYAHIVGNGTSDTARSNAHTLDWNGNAWFAGKVTSENADYAEVGQWADGNTNDEDRIGYFVAIDDTTEGRTMVKATSTADVRGVTVDSPAFSSGYSADKADSNGELFKQYDYVAIMGIVPVIDNGTCTVNGRCMPADDGTAIPSTNNLGYQIIERIDSTRVMIALEPGVDMTQRIKTDIEELQNGKMDAPFKPAGKSYLTFSSPNSFTLAVGDATKHWDGTLEYFASNETWTTWDGTTTLSSVDNDGEYVLYMRGTGNTVITGNSSNYKWVLTGTDISCIGNIENLLDYVTVEAGVHPTLPPYCYSYMFQDCTSLTQAPALPATTLADYCYYSMFRGCTALVQAPALPAITLSNSCYESMFSGCTSLTQATALPATKLPPYCYSYMFKGCTSITQAPSLPATKLAERCYYSMFQGCTSLTQAPALPATTLGYSCYNSMFRGCTALTKAPALPATTLDSFCYSQMFRDCTSLTQAPALPATTLVASCYYSLFQDCTSLTQAPALPATTLAERCYNGMFNGCTSLKLSSSKTDEYTQEYRIPSSGSGTTATDALSNMFASTGGTFTGTPEINTTYYLGSDNMIVRETEVATLREYVGSIAVPASHASDTDIHVTAEEKAKWNAKSEKSVAFTVTLTATGWSVNAQTVSNSKFVTSGYAYTVCPAGDSFAGYTEAVIYADDVTTAGKMTFHCNEAPMENLTVNILRTEVTA